MRQSTDPVSGRTLMLSLSAVLLNLGLVLAIVPEHPVTAIVFTLSLVSALAGVLVPTLGPLKHARPRHTAGVLGAGLVAQLLLMLRLPPAYVLDPPFPMAGLPFGIGLFALSVLTLIIVLRPVRSPLFAPFLLLLIVYVAMGAWRITVSPDPWMDVHIFQEQGAEALLRGENPYSIRTYPDLYGEDSGLYAPGLVEDGYLTFGFTYPPLSLLMALPGHLLGDYRYVQLATMVLSALLIASIRPGKIAMLAALLLLLSPRGHFVLEAGWTDPYALMLLAGVVLLAVRESRLLPVALGLLVAVKQHLVVVLPLAIVLLNGTMSAGDRWRLAALSSAVALAVSLPMILWNLPDFVESAIMLHLRQPFRADSMSYLAWLGEGGQPWLPTWVGFALLLPTAAIALWRLGRSPAGFATTVMIVYFVFFLFSKQAFVHYYYFIVGTLCIAIVAWSAAASARDAEPARHLE